MTATHDSTSHRSAPPARDTPLAQVSSSKCKRLLVKRCTCSQTTATIPHAHIHVRMLCASTLVSLMREVTRYAGLEGGD